MFERIRAFYVILQCIDLNGLINSERVSLQRRGISYQCPDFQHFRCHVVFIKQKRRRGKVWLGSVLFLSLLPYQFRLILCMTVWT